MTGEKINCASQRFRFLCFVILPPARTLRVAAGRSALSDELNGIIVMAVTTYPEPISDESIHHYAALLSSFMEQSNIKS